MCLCVDIRDRLTSETSRAPADNPGDQWCPEGMQCQDTDDLPRVAVVQHLPMERWLLSTAPVQGRPKGTALAQHSSRLWMERLPQRSLLQC